MNNLKSRIEEIPKLLNITVKEFRELLGLTSSQYYQLKNGILKPYSYLEIFHNLGISTNWLLFGYGYEMLDKNNLYYRSTKFKEEYHKMNKIIKLIELEEIL